MKLANLAYETVRDSIEFQSGLSFDGFIRGDYDGDRDFGSQISFAFNYINLALSRLLTSKKTMLKTKKITTDSTGYAVFKDGEITALVSDLSRDYERIHYALFNEGIAVEKDYCSKVVYAEYRPTLPHFDLSSIREYATDEDDNPTYVEKEVELEDYGITDAMCDYVKEYAKGGLMEYLSPELSQRHIQMAEAYFNSLQVQYTKFPQRKIENRFGNGGAW